METHEEYMRIAIEEAKIAASLGESPIGAVIVLWIWTKLLKK